MHSRATLIQQLRAMPRDKADTLLLVSTCVLTLIPFAAAGPAWAGLAAAVLVAWRVLITVRGQVLPEKWLLSLLAVVLVTGVFLHFHTWLSKDAGVTFLMLLVCLKMLELDARRDAIAVVFAGYFLLVGQLLYSQTLPCALYLLFCAALLVSTQLTFQYHELTPPFSRRLFSGFKIVGMALPLALMLFLFFPRIQGPLWGKQQGNASGVTGLSASMEPGMIAELARSDQIAFRAKFPGNTPAAAQLYWRAVILDTFTGSRWIAAEGAAHTDPPVPGRAIAVTQEIIMEPHNQRWLFGLDQPAYLSSYNGIPVSGNDTQYGRLTGYGEMRSPGPIQDRIRYTITSYLNDPRAPAAWLPLSAAQRSEIQHYALQLPQDYNPLTLRWAQQQRHNSSDPIQLANLVLQFFHSQPFRYTLNPPVPGVNQVDDFMFGTQAGFCEHYASAFVVVMRAMHIPARVVTGYQGGELNPVDGLLTVRQSDAHAWAEIWVERRGWIRVDPTAAVAPERVEHGISDSLPNHHFSRHGWMSDLARQLRAHWDAGNSAWNLWVLNYNLNKQLNLLSTLSGIEHPQPAQLGMAMMLAAGAVAAVFSMMLVVRNTELSALDRVYQRFCLHLSRRGYPRMGHEGAADYCVRLQQAFPEQQEFVSFLRLYNECKYGTGYNSRQLSNLKKLLKLCLQQKPAHAASNDSPRSS